MWVVGKGEHFDHWVKDHHNPKNQGQPTHKQKCKLLSNAKKREKQNLRVHFLDLNLYQPVSLMLRSFILFIYSFLKWSVNKNNHAISKQKDQNTKKRNKIIRNCCNNNWATCHVEVSLLLLLLRTQSQWQSSSSGHPRSSLENKKAVTYIKHTACSTGSGILVLQHIQHLTDLSHTVQNVKVWWKSKTKGYLPWTWRYPIKLICVLLLFHCNFSKHYFKY